MISTATRSLSKSRMMGMYIQNAKAFSGGVRPKNPLNTTQQSIQNLVKKQEQMVKSAISQEQASRAPQQGEIRFLDNIQFDEEQDDIVPEIYREHRHRFSKQPEDLDAYKR